MYLPKNKELQLKMSHKITKFMEVYTVRAKEY
jgi:hypothetical protein